MRRRERPTAYGFSAGDSRSPIFRLLALLLVLGLIYGWAREPRSWHWLAADAAGPLADAEPADRDARPGPGHSAPAPASETITPGPNNSDRDEAAAARKLFEALSDRAPLSPEEMPAYWKLMKWANSQSFGELERRADRHVVYTKLWEQPDVYRGKLIRLRLHIRRIVGWDAPQNSAGVHHVYEVWGWTDESKSFPYVVVTSELPEGMTSGDDLRQEGIFAGYFLKTMAYTAYNKNRSSPLLIGRLQQAGPAAAKPVLAGRGDYWPVAVCAVLVLVSAAGFWMWFRRKGSPIPVPPAQGESELERWFQGESTNWPSDSARPE